MLWRSSYRPRHQPRFWSTRYPSTTGCRAVVQEQTAEMSRCDSHLTAYEIAGGGTTPRVDSLICDTFLKLYGLFTSNGLTGMLERKFSSILYVVFLFKKDFIDRVTGHAEPVLLKIFHTTHHDIAKSLLVCKCCEMTDDVPTGEWGRRSMAFKSRPKGNVKEGYETGMYTLMINLLDYVFYDVERPICLEFSNASLFERSTCSWRARRVLHHLGREDNYRPLCFSLHMVVVLPPLAKIAIAEIEWQPYCPVSNSPWEHLLTKERCTITEFSFTFTVFAGRLPLFLDEKVILLTEFDSIADTIKLHYVFIRLKICTRK